MKTSISFTIVLLLTCLSLNTTASNTLSLSTSSVEAYQSTTVSIDISNSDLFVGFQLDILIPSEFDYIENSASLNSSRANGHELSATMLQGNVLRLISYSFSNSAFTGNQGTVVQFNLMAGTAPGSYSLQAQNVVLGDTSSNNILSSASGAILTLLAPDVNLTAANIDFGEIPLLQTQNRSITIQNLGNQNLNISNIQFDSPWFTINGSSSFVVSAGGNQTLSLVFDSQVKGTYSNTISIYSDDPDEPVATATLNAFAFAVNELHTGSAFGFSGDQVSLNFSINNMEAFTGFQFDLQLPSVASYVPGSATLSNRENGHLISASQTNQSTLRVVAYSIGNTNFSGIVGDVLSLDLAIDGVAGNYNMAVQNVIIGDTLGDNIVSDSYNGTLEIGAADIHGSTNIIMGDVSVIDTALTHWTVYNTGTDTLLISDFIFPQPHFWTSESTPVLILPGQSHQIPIYFNATLEGLKSTNMAVLSNDPNENPYTVTLSANSFYPNYLSADTVEGFRSSLVEIPVAVNNYEAFVGFQFDLSYPALISPNTSASYLGQRAQDHFFHLSDLGSNTLRAFSFSMTQNDFNGNSGNIATLAFNTHQIPNGVYNLNFSNVILGDSNSENILYDYTNSVLVIADSLNFEPQTSNPSYLGAGNGEISLSISGGTPPYSITWSNGANNTQIMNLDGGQYGVTVSDRFNQEWSDTLTLIEPNYEQQAIPIASGWHLFSTYLIPLNNNMISVFEEIVPHVIIVKDEVGKVYWPYFGLDLIGSLTLGKAYQINLSEADTLNIVGYGITPENTILDIPMGWSLLGYLRRTEAPIDNLLSPIVNQLLIAKNEAGLVYWPYFGLNLIGNMKPGKGYQINMQSAVQYSYPVD